MDIYDEEIERLTTEYEQDIEVIQRSWSMGDPLFKIVGYSEGSDIVSGCLTMIRGRKCYGAFINGVFNEELTMEIRNDEGIPKSRALITSKHLERFAYWQRRINSMKEQTH